MRIGLGLSLLAFDTPFTNLSLIVASKNVGGGFLMFLLPQNVSLILHCVPLARVTLGWGFEECTMI